MNEAGTNSDYFDIAEFTSKVSKKRKKDGSNKNQSRVPTLNQTEYFQSRQIGSKTQRNKGAPVTSGGASQYVGEQSPSAADFMNFEPHSESQNPHSQMPHSEAEAVQMEIEAVPYSGREDEPQKDYKELDQAYTTPAPVKTMPFLRMNDQSHLAETPNETPLITGNDDDEPQPTYISPSPPKQEAEYEGGLGETEPPAGQ